MKKILSLLTATSFVTMMPELVAISSYEKEDKLSTSNFENEFFQDFQAVIENLESNNVEVSTLKTYTRVKSYSYLDDDNQKVPFVTDTTEAERDFVNLMNKFVKAYGLKTLNNIVKKISVVNAPKYENYFMYSDLWPEWLFTLNKKLNVIRTQMCGMGCTYNHFVKTNNDILYSPAIAFDMFDFVNTVSIGVLAKDQNYVSTNSKTNLHIIAHEFAHAFETYFSFKKGYRNLLKDGISLSKFFFK